MYPWGFPQPTLPMYRPRKKKKAQITLPVSIRCGACRNKMRKGTKLMSCYHKVFETFRYYFKCTKCNALVKFKSDPKNKVYSAVCWAPQYETSQDEDEMVEGAKRKRTTEEIGDANAVNSLENMTLDSRGEQMDLMAGAGLDVLTSVKASKLNMKGLPDEDDEPTSSSALTEQTNKLSMKTKLSSGKVSDVLTQACISESSDNKGVCFENAPLNSLGIN